MTTHDNPDWQQSDDWLDDLCARIDSIDWTQLARSRYTLRCKTLRNRATLLYPASLWHADVRAFEWLQACAIANQLQLRESDSPAADTTLNQTVSTLGLHMLLYPQQPGHNAEQPLQNTAPGCDVTAVLRLAQLAHRHGRRHQIASNPLLQTEADTIHAHSCQIVGSISSRVFQYYAGRQTRVANYSVGEEQYVDVLLGGGDAAAPLPGPLERLVGHRIELEILAQPDKPVIGILRACYSRALAAAAGYTAAPDETSAATLSPA